MTMLEIIQKHLGEIESKCIEREFIYGSMQNVFFDNTERLLELKKLERIYVEDKISQDIRIELMRSLNGNENNENKN